MNSEVRIGGVYWLRVNWNEILLYDKKGLRKALKHDYGMLFLVL